MCPCWRRLSMADSSVQFKAALPVIYAWRCYDRLLVNALNVRKLLCLPATPYDARAGRTCCCMLLHVVACCCSHALRRVLRAPLLAFRACRFAGPAYVLSLVSRKRLLIIAANVDLRTFRGECPLGESKGCRQTPLPCAGSLDISTVWLVIVMLFHLRRLLIVTNLWWVDKNLPEGKQHGTFPTADVRLCSESFPFCQPRGPSCRTPLKVVKVI